MSEYIVWMRIPIPNEKSSDKIVGQSKFLKQMRSFEKKTINAV